MKACNNCSKPITRTKKESLVNFTKRKFCSQSCSAQYNNGKRTPPNKKTKEKTRQKLEYQYKNKMIKIFGTSSSEEISNIIINEINKREIKSKSELKEINVVFFRKVEWFYFKNKKIYMQIMRNFKRENIVYRIKNVSKKKVSKKDLNLLKKFCINKKITGSKSLREQNKELYNLYKWLSSHEKEEFLSIKKILSKNFKDKKSNKIKKNMKAIKIIANNHKTKTSFFSKNRNEYQSALNYDKRYPGYFKEICSHMEDLGSAYDRCIYAIIFPKIKKVYIGLTYNYNERIDKHKNSNKTKTSKLIKSGESFFTKKLTNYLPVEEAKNKEEYYIKEFEKKGYSSLNISKPGGTGGTVFMSNEEIILYAKKCSNYAAFRKNRKYYDKAIRRNLLPKIKSFFGLSYTYKPNSRSFLKYPKNQRELVPFLIKESKKFSSLKELRENYDSLYKKINKNPQSSHIIKEAFS